MASGPLDHIADYASTHAPAGSLPDAAGAVQETAARLPTREHLDEAIADLFLAGSLACHNTSRGVVRCWVAFALDSLGAPQPDAEVRDAVASLRRAHALCCGEVTP